MSTGAVQFKGKDAAMRAFEYNKIPNWALYVGRELLTSYTGRNLKDATDALDQFLDMLKEHNSAGTYQLRMYHDLKTRVNSTTPYTNSFKFKLLDDEEYEGTGGSPQYRAVMARIEQLQAQLLAREIEDDEDQDEEETMVEKIISGMQSAIVEKIKDPAVMNLLMGKVIGWIGQVTGAAQPAASMNGQTSILPNDQAFMALPDDQKAALDKAMAILLNGDPQIGTNLLKLANILATDPKKYASLAAMI